MLVNSRLLIIIRKEYSKYKSVNSLTISIIKSEWIYVQNSKKKSNYNPNWFPLRNCKYAATSKPAKEIGINPKIIPESDRQKCLQNKLYNQAYLNTAKSLVFNIIKLIHSKWLVMPITLNITFNLLTLLYYKHIVGELLLLKKNKFWTILSFYIKQY